MWFSDNHSDHSKCHLLLSTSESLSIQIGGSFINSSETKKLLGVHCDHKLIFDSHKWI